MLNGKSPLLIPVILSEGLKTTKPIVGQQDFYDHYVQNGV